MTLPWEEEDDSAVGSSWIEQAHLLRAVVAGKHDVDTGAWAANLLHFRVVHLSDAVGEWTGGVDDALRLDSPLLLAQVVAQLGSAEHFVSAGVLLLQQFLNFDVIRDSSTVTGGSQSHSQAHTGVILLSIVVDDGAAQFVALQHGEFVEGVLL